MKWVFELFREFLEKEWKNKETKPRQEDLEILFQEIVKDGLLKILVQEPWMGTIRFKTLFIGPMSAKEVSGLYENPMNYLFSRYGGGKFKVNFYRGMHFIATKNFKPQGEPAWVELPEWVEDGTSPEMSP